MMLEAWDLRRRGWTDHLLRHFAPRPADHYIANRVGYMNPTRLWRRDTVIRAERSPAFQASLRRSLRRRRLDRVAALMPEPGFMLATADLKRRAWNADLIATFAPSPDRHRDTAEGAAEPLWSPEAIVRAEASPEFQRALQRALRDHPLALAPALRCALTVERLTAGLGCRVPTAITIKNIKTESDAALLYIGNRHDMAAALGEYNRRRRERGKLTLEAFHALCRPSKPTPCIITEEHRRAADRTLRTLWEANQDTGAKVELELREKGARRRLLPGEEVDRSKLSDEELERYLEQRKRNTEGDET